jgi:hypothetical protein
MPIKTPCVTQMDLVRARQLVCSLTPLKVLSVDDSELVARAMAGCFAKGREQGWHQAWADLGTPGILPPLPPNSATDEAMPGPEPAFAALHRLTS